MTLDLEGFLAPHAADIQAIVRRVRTVLMAANPGLDETQDNENLGFGCGTGYSGLIFTVAPYKQHVNIGIYDGVKLPDPAGLMAGKGKRHRHVKIRSVAELENPALLALLGAAVVMKKAAL